MSVLSAFAAISACRFVGERSAVLRQEDSSTPTLLTRVRESADVRVMANAPSALPPELPGDIDALKALNLAERAAHAAERDQVVARNEKLEYIVAEMRRAMFGRRSEKIDNDQLKLRLLGSARDLSAHGNAIRCHGPSPLKGARESPESFGRIMA
jgi:Transposase C of IS166 homeodomain